MSQRSGERFWRRNVGALPCAERISYGPRPLKDTPPLPRPRAADMDQDEPSFDERKHTVRYMCDVRWAIRLLPSGKWWAFERSTGDEIGEYDSEPDARKAIRHLDPTGMIRINSGKIIGGPTVDEMSTWTTEMVRNFQDLHPGHVGASNVLSDKLRHKRRWRSTIVVDPEFFRRGHRLKGRSPNKRDLK
jgi:hypothetical protein